MIFHPTRQRSFVFRWNPQIALYASLAAIVLKVSPHCKKCRSFPPPLFAAKLYLKKSGGFTSDSVSCGGERTTARLRRSLTKSGRGGSSKNQTLGPFPLGTSGVFFNC